MKERIRFSLLLVFLTIYMVSCKEKVEGVYVCKRKTYTATLEFLSKNRVLTVLCDSNGKVEQNTLGTYIEEKDKLIITFPEGVTVFQKIKNTLTVEDYVFIKKK